MIVIIIIAFKVQLGTINTYSSHFFIGILVAIGLDECISLSVGCDTHRSSRNEQIAIVIGL